MVRLGDLCDAALLGIWRQKLRAATAMATIAVAIFSIALIVGNAVARHEALVLLMNTMFDSTVLRISPPAAAAAGERPRRARLEMRDLDALAGIPGVSRAAPITSLPVLLKSGRETLEGEALATTPALVAMLQLKILSGRTFRLAEDECLLTQESAQALLRSNAVGQTVRINGRPMRVVGVVDPLRTRMAVDCLMPLAAGRAVAHISSVTAICIRTVDVAAMPQVRRTVTGYVAAEFGAGYSRKMVRADTDANEQSIASLNRSLLSQGVFVTLGLLLAIATVAEMLYADVQANLAELGILRALGATKRDILCQIALQSVLICLAGGGIGLMLTQSYYLWPEQLRESLRWKDSVSTVYVGLVMSFTAGVAASLMPAYAATQVSPTEAMREADR